MADAAGRLMTAEEFFAWHPPDDESRWELVDGVPVRMQSGASNAHDTIVVNVLLSLGNQLRGSPCQPWTADASVRTRIGGVRRPDVTVACGEQKPDAYELENPRLIVEVLSETNKGVRWVRKLEEYRRREGLLYLLLVESESVGATLLSRQNAAWEPADYDTLADMIELPETGCRLAMSEMYARLPVCGMAGSVRLATKSALVLPPPLRTSPPPAAPRPTCGSGPRAGRTRD